MCASRNIYPCIHFLWFFPPGIFLGPLLVQVCPLKIFDSSIFGDWWFFTILKENILWNLYFKEHLTNTFITILISLFPNKEKLCFFITQTSWFPRTPTSVQLIQKTMFHLRSLQPNAVFWEEHTSELIVVFSTFDFSFLFRTTREFAWLMPTFLRPIQSFLDWFWDFWDKIVSIPNQRLFKSKFVLDQIKDNIPGPIPLW